MKRRPLRDHGAAPSLVPLADMLTNTVGIMLFILIFTVLATAGASVQRAFPQEHTTEKSAVFVICAHGRFYPISLGSLGRAAYLDDKPTQIDPATLNHKTEGTDIDMEGVLLPRNVPIQFAQAFAIEFAPRADSKLSTDKAFEASPAVRRLLDETDAAKRYFYFFVWPDSVDVFVAVRDLIRKRGYDYGWSPQGADEKVSVIFISRGPSGMPATVQ
jgi:hypothetical protein